ncbi:LuxR C-terminal-related transcriptional regulator [Nocardia sp. NBC_01327]|uniref:LuxR C-terminal-related transcriptional regulator n=1 Tax=Nocardia sp. NBC_01327 TaxID=2903593 RepID=UPI002E0F0ADA|nr:LuxR C-terminal-related transcriptional regulator [Nocardia sp. NBC_01327]
MTRSPVSGRSGLIDRRALVAALDRGTDKPVTIISAPAGSGKTSLLRSWAEGPGRTRRIAFVTVRPGQHDAQPFWLALLGAVRAAASDAGHAVIPSATPDFNGDTMAERLLAEFSEVDGTLVLVIDDLHEIGAPETFEQLTALLTDLPPHVHAILAARRDPPLRLHRLRLAGELTELRSAHLRFTEIETSQFLTAAGLTLPHRAAELLHQRTEGWVAGLRLAALSLADHPDPERFVAEFSGSDRTVAEYLIAEMLEQQPAHVQRLLLRTSLLDRVNGELADLLTGSAGSARILLDLEDANAFVVSLDPGRMWFRYHHLFRGLLRLELRRTATAELPGLHARAARWLAAHGYTAEAIGHFQAAGDWTEAAELLTEHALSLTLDGRAGTVRALLRSFPSGPGENSPELAPVYAIADLDQLRLDEAAAHLHLARSAAAAAPPDRRHRRQLAILSLELLLARLRGHFDGVVEQVNSLPAPAAGQSNADIALGSDLRTIALLNLGVAESWSLRMPESERHLREGAELAREIGRPYLEVACRAQLGFAATARSLTEARRFSSAAIALAAEHGWDEQPVIAPALATLAGTMIWTGAFDEGEHWLDRALRVTREGSEPGLRLLLHLLGGMLHAARGRYRQALAEFEIAGQVQANMAGEHALAGRVLGGAVAAQARLGMPGKARATLAALGGQHTDNGEIRTATAIVCLAENDPASARSTLRAVLDGSAPVTHDFTRVEAHLLNALACRAEKEDRALRAGVEAALELAEPERLILPFILTGGWELLESVPAHSTSHAALITDILDAAQGSPPARTVVPPAEHLSPTELRLLRYLPTNLTRPEIAGELSVSVNTVNTHIRNIYTKLGVTDRSTAVQRGRELHLLSAGRT